MMARPLEKENTQHSQGQEATRHHRTTDENRMVSYVPVVYILNLKMILLSRTRRGDLNITKNT